VDSSGRSWRQRPSTAQRQTAIAKLSCNLAQLSEPRHVSQNKAKPFLEDMADAIFYLMDVDASGFVDKREAKGFQDKLRIASSLWGEDLHSNCNARLSKADLREKFKEMYRTFRRDNFIDHMRLTVEILERSDLGGASVSSDSFAELRDGLGCILPRIEERAILRRQLRKVMAFAKARCSKEGWKDTFTGKALAITPQTMNLYQAVDKIVKPATKARGCSFVEFTASGPQRPKWFVSHWWGEPVQDFLTCLEQHATDRGLQDEDAYWVCAYAINQWDIASEVSCDPKKSGFRKALDVSVGTLSILDKEAVCFSRIWCCYEIWVSLESERDYPYRYDMYTVSGSKAVGISDGFCEDSGIDRIMSLGDKARRERNFPFKLCRRAMEIKLEQGKASDPVDRKRILNSIIGQTNWKKLTSDPPDEHREYDKLNCSLNGRIASAAWRSAVEAGEDMAPYIDALSKCKLPKLEVSFENCAALKDSDIDNIGAAMGPELAGVNMDFTSCAGLTCKGLTSLGKGMMRVNALRSIALNFRRCDGLADKGVEFLGSAIQDQGSSLREVHLGFRNCGGISDDGAKGILNNLPAKAESIRLDFSHNSQITDEAIRRLEEQSFNDLRELHIKLTACSAALTDVAIEAISTLLVPSLRELHLDLHSGAAITHIGLNTFGQALKRLEALQELTLDFSGVEAVNDDLFAFLPLSPHTLKLKFDHCPKVTNMSVKALGRSLSKKVQRLTISLNGNQKVSADVLKSLAGMLPDGLKSFELHLSGCHCADEARSQVEEVMRGRPATESNIIVDAAAAMLGCSRA